MATFLVKDTAGNFVRASYVTGFDGNPVRDPNWGKTFYTDAGTPVYNPASITLYGLDKAPLDDQNSNGYLIGPENYNISSQWQVGAYINESATAVDLAHALNPFAPSGDTVREAAFDNYNAPWNAGNIQKTYDDVVNGPFVRNFTDIASYNYGLVAAASGVPLATALRDAGNFNIAQSNLGRDLNTKGAFGNPERNIATITQGYNDGLAYRAGSTKCFSAETRILKAEGDEVSIKDIAIGDDVLAYHPTRDLGRGPVIGKKVIRLLTNITTEWIELRALGRELVYVTPGHRYLSPGGGFETIDSLIKGAELSGEPLALILGSGEVVTVTYARHVYSATTAGQFEQSEATVYLSIGGLALKPLIKRGWKTYNFEVEELHTYIAGGIRVHNDSWDVNSAAIDSFAADNNLVAVSYDTVSTEFGPATAEVDALVAQQQSGFNFSTEEIDKFASAINQANSEHYDRNVAAQFQASLEAARKAYDPYGNITGLPSVVDGLNIALKSGPNAKGAISSIGNYNAGDYGTATGAFTDADGQVHVVVDAHGGLIRDIATGAYAPDFSGLGADGTQGYGGGLTINADGSMSGSSGPSLGDGGAGGGYSAGSGSSTYGGGGGQGGVGNSPGSGGAGPTGGGSSGDGGGQSEGGSGGPGGSSSSGSGGDGPIILDLNGSGVNLTKLTSSNTFFDMTGTGEKSLTAWAGVGNGVLFVDTTGTGKLTQANQVVFTDWDPTATSDLQALEDVFDTNHDGRLDAGDADFADFYVMETNANGTQTPVSLASLGITSINLTANTVDQALDDGSMIDGESTYTTSSGVTRTAATVTFATDGEGHAVVNTTASNADGSETISNAVLNTDGSVAYTRILNTSSNGLTKTLSDLNAGGVVTGLQTDVTTVSGSTTTETVTNYANGTVTAASGELTASGVTGDDKLNSETTTTTTGSGSAKTVTIARDQLGGGWTTESETDTYNASGLLTSDVVSDLNNDGSKSNFTTTTVSTDGLTRTVTSLVDNISADSTTSVDATSFGTASGGNPAPETEVVTDSVGTTTVSKATTATTTTTGLVTRVVTSDLTDGSTLNLTTTETTATSGSGSTTTTVDTNANGSFRDESVETVDPTGLLKTTKTDSTGAGSATSPVFNSIETDNTVVNSDQSRTETITETSNNGSLRYQSVNQRFIDGVSRNISIDSTGDGIVDQTEVISDVSGAVTDTTKDLNPDGTLATETVVSTSAGGLVKTTSVDNTGAVGSGSSPVFDLVTTDTVTHNSNGSETEVVKETNANGSTRQQTTINTSASGLIVTTAADFTGASGVADGTTDRTTTDTTTVNSDGSLLETIVTVDQYGNTLTSKTQTTSANRLLETITSTLGSTGLAKSIETITTAANGTITDQSVKYDQNGDVLGATSTSTTADGLTQIKSTDVQGQSAGTSIAYNVVTTDQTVINADGSRTRTDTSDSQNGSLLANQVTTTSANGLSVSSSSDTYGQGWFYTITSDTTVINADGSKKETTTDRNNNNSERDQTITTTSATGLSITTAKDYNGDGTIDLTTTDATTINADGSTTEVVTDTNASGVRDQTTTTSGVIGSYGQTTTIDRQSNGSVATYSVETIQTGSNGSTFDIVKNYAASGGVELYGSEETVSANGLVKGTYLDVNGDGTYDISTLDTIVINADGSTTETIAKSNGTALINETVTSKSANGLFVTTSIDANGATSSGAAVFNEVIADDTVLNSNGSSTETVSKAASGTVFEESVKTISADQQTITTNFYLNETGSISTIDKTETTQTQANGSIVETTTSYDASHASLGSVIRTTSGNGLSTTVVSKNAAGTTIDTQTEAEALNANGSQTDTFTDSGNSTTSITTNITGSGLAKTVSTSVTLGSVSYTASSSDTTTLSTTGGTTEVISDTIGTTSTHSDKTTLTISANGRSKTISTDENGDGTSDYSDQTTVALDGSQTETTDYYSPGADALAMSLVVSTSTDGRTITTTEQSDYDGTKFNVQTDAFVQNTNNTTTETKSASGSFGASTVHQTINSITNTDGSLTTTAVDSDSSGVIFGRVVSAVSANGLVKSAAYNVTGQESQTNLNAVSVDLLSGTALPSGLLPTDILGMDKTTLNSDGSQTEVIQTEYGSGTLRSKISITTIANGLTTTTSVDEDGNGVNEQIDTLKKLADDSSIDTYNYYNNSNSSLIGTNTVTTSASGLSSTLVSSVGVTDVTSAVPGMSGSYTWVQTVNSTGTSKGYAGGSASHFVDANGIDTWTWQDSSSGGTSGSITIDTTTEATDVAIANGIYETILGTSMTQAETEYLAQYISNGVLNRVALATSLITSSTYQSAFNYDGYSQASPMIFLFHALGRLPTAEEIAEYEQPLTGVTTAVLDQRLAQQAVAVAQYASELGQNTYYGQTDPNQGLISAIPIWSPGSSGSATLLAPGVYTLSDAWSYLGAATAFENQTITGNDNALIPTAAGATLSVSGYSNIVGGAYTDLSLTASNSAIFVASTTEDDASGSNDQFFQAANSKLVLSSGSGDTIYISAATYASNSSSAWYTSPYSYTSASNATIEVGTSAGTSSNPDQINGNNDIISLSAGDNVTVSGSSDTIDVAGNLGGQTVHVTSSNATVNVTANGATVNSGGSGNTINIETSGDGSVEFGSSNTINITSASSWSTLYGTSTTVTDSAASGTIYLMGNSETATLSGASSTVNFEVTGTSSSVQVGTVHGVGTTINVSGANSNLQLYGSGNTVNMEATSEGLLDYTTSGDIVNITATYTWENIYGNNASITDSAGESWIDLAGYGENVNATGAHDTITVAGSNGASQAAVIQSLDATINVTGSNATVNSGGSGNTINLSASSNGVVESGSSGDVINVTATNTWETVYGTGTSLTDNAGSGWINLFGANEIATDSGSHDQFTVSGSGSHISATGSNETFIYDAGFGTASLTGFSGASSDLISLASSEFANFAAVLSDTTTSGSNSIITAANGDAITLVGVSKSTLVAADFSFHT